MKYTLFGKFRKNNSENKKLEDHGYFSMILGTKKEPTPPKPIPLVERVDEDFILDPSDKRYKNKTDSEVSNFSIDKTLLQRTISMSEIETNWQQKKRSRSLPENVKSKFKVGKDSILNNETDPSLEAVTWQEQIVQQHTTNDTSRSLF